VYARTPDERASRVAQRLVVICALALTIATVGVDPADAIPPRGHPCLVATGGGDAPFERNFNPFLSSLDFTRGGIYEPLVIVSAGGDHQYDWLAAGLHWSRDRRVLTIAVRRGVRWTDGRLLTSADVAYSLTAGRQSKAMDQIGLLRPGNQVESVRALGPYRVAIRLERPDSTFVSRVLAAGVVVVPKHVFARVKSVGSWTNPHPVGTGPFAIVQRFNDQSYTLARNPSYWRAGAPHIACVERVLASSSDAALFQIRRGDVDLTNDFFPNVRNAYVVHNPVYFHYFYPANSPATGLFFDDTLYPYSLAVLRKAISLAINRAAISRLGEDDYAPTVDALGIDRTWPGWIDKHTAAESNKLASYDPSQAKRLLLDAGFGYLGTTLIDPRGDPVVMRASVVVAWTDWYADWQVIGYDLRRIGIKVELTTSPDFSAWYPTALATKSATLLWNSATDAASPYGYFAEHLDDSSFVASGHSAVSTGDWEHFKSLKATRLLAKFRLTTDTHVQHRIATQIERIWLKTLPFVPLFGSPTWSTYSTRYFIGFPNAENDYVQPDFTQANYVVALTRIRRRHKMG
jgi:peptide/nickel transport system substrate-binding protein